MRSPLNYREQTDEMLVRLTLVRDEAAFEELVKRHQRAALLIAQSVTKNLYTAEDAVQDAFLTAWQRLDTLKDPAKFGPWVCRIAKYRAINLAKRYRDYIPFDEVENYVSDVTEDISGYYDGPHGDRDFARLRGKAVREDRDGDPFALFRGAVHQRHRQTNEPQGGNGQEPPVRGARADQKGIGIYG